MNRAVKKEEQNKLSLSKCIFHVVFFLLILQGEKKATIIQNVSSVIKGSEEPDCQVLLGNHRNA